jgi:hypothetical protein
MHDFQPVSVFTLNKEADIVKFVAMQYGLVSAGIQIQLKLAARFLGWSFGFISYLPHSFMSLSSLQDFLHLG